MFRDNSTFLLRAMTVIVWLLCAFFCFPSMDCAAASNDIKFSIDLDKNEYKDTEPIYANFKLENKGKNPVYVNKRFYVNMENSAKEERDVYLVVTGPSGDKLGCKFYYKTGFPKSDYFELLKPSGKAVSEWKRDLRSYFDFSEPGTYKVAAIYQNVYGKEIGLDVFSDKVTSPAVSFKIIKSVPDNKNR